MTPRPVLRILSSVAPRIQTPGLVHVHDGIDALPGAEQNCIDRLRIGHRVAVQRDHLELMAGERDAAVFDRAGVEEVHQHALALLHADRLARAEALSLIE